MLFVRQLGRGLAEVSHMALGSQYRGGGKGDVLKGMMEVKGRRNR